MNVVEISVEAVSNPEEINRDEMNSLPCCFNLPAQPQRVCDILEPHQQWPL